MKRIRAHSLTLLVSLACLAPCAAAAKSSSVPLPDRNPERPPAAAQQAVATPEAQSVTPDAAPSAKEAAPSATEAAPSPAAPEPVPAGNETTVAAIPEPERNPAKPVPQAGAPVGEAAAPTPVNVPLPDVNPNRGLPMSPPAPQPALNYSAVLKPLLSYDLSAADEANLKIVAHGKGNVDATATKISDTAARVFALWYRYKHNKSTTLTAEAVEQFRLTHPDWPGQDELREKAETSLFLTDASPEQVKLFFGGSDPQTGAGKAALATVYLKEGNETGAKELVVSAWRDHMLNVDVEKKILDKFGSMLTAEHHRARIDRFLYPDKESLAGDALRIAKLLPADEQKKVEARVAVLKRGGNAGKLLDALPDDAIKADVGLRFNNIQWLRRTKDKDQRLLAFKLLLDAPLEPNVLLDLNEWWVERRINVRAALSDGHPRTAYEIAAKHGLASGDSFIEAEFLAGWIALRFLNEPHTALRHFLALRKAATSSKNIALGEYWLGRTALTLGDRGSALIHFHGAAKYPQYFYGQLGRQALDPRPARLEVTSTPVPTQADIDRFMANDGVRAIGIARAANMEWVTPQFFFAMARTLDSAAEVVLLAELAKAMDQRQIGLRLAKIAFNRDLPLGDYALPVGVMPAFKSLLEERVDPALCHALSRQESEFNASAKSPVGASGLMQLMPATAKGVARRYKVTYSQAQLTNPTYNQQLGEAFLNDLISSYSGSYFLALTAYNAGPGRVKEWMEKHGDPRNPDVDPVDWIERIPFTETREYVFKIMETLQLYRSRLSGPDQALHLVQDLNRGRKVPSSETASVAIMPATKAP